MLLSRASSSCLWVNREAVASKTWKSFILLPRGQAATTPAMQQGRLDAVGATASMEGKVLLRATAMLPNWVLADWEARTLSARQASLQLRQILAASSTFLTCVFPWASRHLHAHPHSPVAVGSGADAAQQHVPSAPVQARTKDIPGWKPASRPCCVFPSGRVPRQCAWRRRWVQAFCSSCMPSARRYSTPSSVSRTWPAKCSRQTAS